MNDIIPILKTIDKEYILHPNSNLIWSSILIMEKTGKSYGRIYWYHDDKTSVIIDSLSVLPEYRRQGLGTKMQEIREFIGKQLGVNNIYLWVKQDTWMHDWYLRRGYNDYQEYFDEVNAIWMKKTLI